VGRHIERRGAAWLSLVGGIAGGIAGCGPKGLRVLPTPARLAVRAYRNSRPRCSNSTT
jgi:hypothetical protein